MSIEAMKQALDALEEAHPKPYNESVISHVKAITALRTAIEQAEKQEPVAWANINKHGDITHTNNKRMPWSKTPLYTTPPAQPAKQKPVAWLGLEPSDMPDGDDPMYDHDFFLKGMAWADAILRKKNTTPPAAQQGMTIDASAPLVMTPHPAFAHRSAAQQKPLTKEQVLKLWGPRSDGPDNHEIISFARAIEAAHGITAAKGQA